MFVGRPAPGRRICVVGTSGCGKTYVAEALAQRLGIRYVCNDAIIWRANWVPTPRDERLQQVHAAAALDAWTFDGNLSAPEDQPVLDRFDTIVWLDLPRWQVHSQVLRRTLTGLITKEPLWQHGNVERWRIFFSRDSIVWWSIKTFSKRRVEYAALFADPAHADKVRIRLASRREVNRWLAAIPAFAAP